MNKQYRVGILGSENSHAAAFMEIFKNDPAYSDFQPVAIGGADEESSRALYEKYNLEFIAEKPEDMLGKVDVAMITARDGKFHAAFAQPFIDRGIPLFIDKPFTVDPMEAVALARRAKEKGVPIVGGSSLKNCYDVLMLQNHVKNNAEKLRGGCITAPVNLDNPYSGFFFYSSHLAEISLAVFGYDPQEVIAAEANGSVNAIVRYKDFAVTNCFMDGCYKYAGQIVTKDGIYGRMIDESMGYKHECEEFAAMVRTGKMKHTYSQLVAPVFYLHAVYTSYTERRSVRIDKFEI